MGMLQPGLQPVVTFQVWPRSCPPALKQEVSLPWFPSPPPTPAPSADCCGQAAWGMWHGRRPVPCPQKEAWLKPASPVLVPAGHARSSHGHWSKYPCPWVEAEGAPVSPSSAEPPSAPARPSGGARCLLSWPAPQPACRWLSSCAPAVPSEVCSPGRGRCSWMGGDHSGGVGGWLCLERF